ncbi:MAG: uncharacterized protein A8A55_1088 [Amphiamblys sp. WSBS2006]|nr:MAG: uncharacterized protein A8A55_1088 [Amphiamblys sp. WSBS2006]
MLLFLFSGVLLSGAVIGYILARLLGKDSHKTPKPPAPCDEEARIDVPGSDIVQTGPLPSEAEHCQTGHGKDEGADGAVDDTLARVDSLRKTLSSLGRRIETHDKKLTRVSFELDAV